MVSGTDPSITFIALVSIYSPNNLASNEDVAGAISDGFKTTALPAAIAPITGSKDNTGKRKVKKVKRSGVTLGVKLSV